MEPGHPHGDGDLRPATDRLRIVAMVVSGAVFVGLLVLVLILRERGAKEAEDEIEAPLEVRASSAYVDMLKETLAESPCDRKTAMELAKELIKARRFEETVVETTSFVERCGDFPVLLWKTYYAHEQLSQWAQAAEVAGVLIADDPRDSDFWWWRGKALARAGRLDEAVADYRQAIANSDLDNSNGIHVVGLADIAEEAGVPCEAAAALRLFIDAKAGEVSSRITDRHQRLALSKSCHGQKDVSGSATIALDPEALFSTVEVRIGDREYKFAVDTASGLSILGAELADTLGIEGSGSELSTLALGAIRTGRPAQIRSMDVRSAIATKVDVLVVDELPEGIDGVVGLSYLWRFSYEAWPDKIALVAR